VTITDRSVQPKAKARQKADPADPMQVGAPIPGLITSLAVSVGSKVGQRRQTVDPRSHENAKAPFTHPVIGTVEAIYAQISETVESKDLLVKLRKG